MYALAIFLPLIGAVLAGLFGRWLKDTGSQAVTCGAMLLSALISCFILNDVALEGHPRTIELFTWIGSGTFEVVWALKLDQLAAVMVFVERTVGSRAAPSPTMLYVAVYSPQGMMMR